MKKLVVIGILILLLINIISAQEYTLKVTEEHPFFVLFNNDFINDYAGNFNNVMQDGKEVVVGNGIEKEKKIIGGWIAAKNLKVGDFLITDDGKKAKITSIKEIVDDVEVYNLEANPFNDFIVDGNVVVHNSNILNQLCYRFASMSEADIIEAIRLAERNSNPGIIRSEEAFKDFRTLRSGSNPFSVLSGLEDAVQIRILKQLLSQGKFHSIEKFRILNPSRRQFIELFLENAKLGQEGYTNKEFGILEVLLMNRNGELEIVFLPKIGSENTICLDTSLLVGRIRLGQRVIFARTIHTHLLSEPVARKITLSPNDQLSPITETIQNNHLAAQCSVASNCRNNNLLMESAIFSNPSAIPPEIARSVGINENEIPSLIRGAERVLNRAEASIDAPGFFGNFDSRAKRGEFSDIPLPSGINNVRDVINLGNVPTL